MDKYKIIFIAIILGVLTLVPVTILGQTPVSLLFTDKANIAHTIQRFLGLTIFVLLFFQLMLGSFMEKITERFGGWFFSYHIFEGILIYSLVILHTLSFVFYNYFLGRGFDPIYVYLGFCVLCPNRLELYYTLGRISFWLVTMTVFAGLFRAATPFMQVNWRKFHVFNYVVFLVVGLHGFLVGSDFSYMPYFAFAVLAYITVLLVVIIRKLPQLFNFLFRS